MSLFVFRESPTLQYHTEISKSRGTANMTDTERRFRKAQAIYRIYIENINLFDHVILTFGDEQDLRQQVGALVKGMGGQHHWPLQGES